MKTLLATAAVIAGLLLSATPASAGPFGPNRSEGAPPTKKKPKPEKKKKAKRVDREEDDAPKKVVKAKAAPAEDEELVVIEEDAPVKKSRVADKPVVEKTAPIAPKVGAKKPAPVEDDEIIVIEDVPTPAVAEKSAKPIRNDDVATVEIKAKPPAADDDEGSDEEVEDEAARKTQVAALDEDEAEPAVVKTATKAAPHRTRFYFRAGAMRQSVTLGAPSFSLQTDLAIDTSSVGQGSGVETQDNKIPVGAIIGVVLPVGKRKLSLETVLGIPTPTKFKATGKLATDSLAPTFMGMETGIEPLGSDLGEVTFAPPIVTAVYRVAKLGPVTPVVGTGVMVLMGRNGKITNAVLQEAGDPKLSIKPSPGLVVQGGLDIQLWKRVAARLDVKYVLGMKVNATIEDISVTPKAIPSLGSIEVGDAVLSAKVAPLIIQAGLGVDF